MTKENSIEEIFFRYLKHYSYDPVDLDYQLLEKHLENLQALARRQHRREPGERVLHEEGQHVNRVVGGLPA